MAKQVLAGTRNVLVDWCTAAVCEQRASVNLLYNRATIKYAYNARAKTSAYAITYHTEKCLSVCQL